VGIIGDMQMSKEEKLKELSLINFSKKTIASPTTVKYSTERRAIMGQAPRTTKLIQSKVDYQNDWVDFFFLTEATEKYGKDHEYTDTQPEHQFALERNPSALYELQLRFFGIKRLQELITLSPAEGIKSLQQKPVAKYPTGGKPAPEPTEEPLNEPVEPIPEAPEQPEEEEQPEIPSPNTDNTTANAITPGQAVAEPNPEEIIRQYHNQKEAKRKRLLQAGKFVGAEDDEAINDKVSPGQVDGGAGGLPIWEAAVNGIKITIRKAEGTPRGWGWYYLLNGVKDGRDMDNVGGEDWYPSAARAKVAALDMIAHSHWTKEYGWVSGDALTEAEPKKPNYTVYNTVKNWLWATDFGMFSNDPSWHYQGFNYNLSVLGASIHPTNIEPQVWNKIHGDALVSKHFFDLFLHIGWFINQMASSLLNKLKVRKESVEPLQELKEPSFENEDGEIEESTNSTYVTNPENLSPDHPYTFKLIENPTSEELLILFKDTIRYAKQSRNFNINRGIPQTLRYIIDVENESIWVFSAYCYHRYAARVIGIPYDESSDSKFLFGIGEYSIADSKLYVNSFDYDRVYDKMHGKLLTLRSIGYQSEYTKPEIYHPMEESTQQSPESKITHYLHEYLEDIQEKIDGMFSEAEEEPQLLAASDKSRGNLQEKEPERAKWLFNPEVDLSQDRKKLVYNIVGTLKKFEKTHHFYDSATAVPLALKPYFLEIIYQTIQRLTGTEVLKMIELSRGRESLFTIIYENVQEKNREILEGTDSITFEINGKNITVGANGIPLVEYYKAYVEKPLKTFENPAKYSSMLHNRLKTKVGEAIGISYFIRDFQIPGSQYQRALKTMPHDKSNFPDFLVDTNALSTQTKQHFIDLLGFTPPPYIFFDTKATTVTGARPGMGNERLQYPRVEKIHEFMRNQNIIGPEDVIFDQLPPENHPVVNLTYDDFTHFVKYFISSYYDPKSEEGYLTGKDLCIVYQEVGKNTSTRAKYYLVDILDGKLFQIKKVSNSTYHIIKNGKQKVAVLNFYTPEELKNMLPPHMRNAQEFNISHEIMTQIPIDKWSYMLKWMPEGLKPIQLKPYEPILSKTKEELDRKYKFGETGYRVFVNPTIEEVRLAVEDDNFVDNLVRGIIVDNGDLFIANAAMVHANIAKAIGIELKACIPLWLYFKKRNEEFISYEIKKVYIADSVTITPFNHYSSQELQKLVMGNPNLRTILSDGARFINEFQENTISSQECPECGKRQWIISYNSGQTKTGCTNPECAEYQRRPSELSKDVKRAKDLFYGRDR
jgi:hypothetical protein